MVRGEVGKDGGGGRQGAEGVSGEDILLLLYMETLIFGFTVQFLSTDSNLEDLPTDKSRQAGCTQVG